MPRLRHYSDWTGAEVMFDVFVSYGQADQGWVRTLAENLHREGVEVFYDE